jgi:radical SAM/Cys-rich protein
MSTKSLQAQGNALSDTQAQLEILNAPNKSGYSVPRFSKTLQNFSQFPLKPSALEILQINIGKMCNQTCTHCHVDAGPDRKEIMTRETMLSCLQALQHAPTIHTVDLTGGAPEMNPDFKWFVEKLSHSNVKIIVRSNLTILVSNKKYQYCADFFARHKVTLIASLPCYTAENTDKQRGNGVFQKSLDALKILNEKGYGKPGSGLELHLVYNPGGPSLPPPQAQLEMDYKKMLSENFGIQFNKLFTITNLPISRFLDALLTSGKYELYMEKLVNAFNPATIDGLMCKNTLSVGWDGKLYDCDFNQMLELQTSENAPKYIRDFNNGHLLNRTIVLGQHCYGCTAGAGSSCQGTIL